MESRYASFTDEQFDEFKKRLHSKIHWLLIYKEEKKDDVLRGYFDNLMQYVGGLNELLEHNAQVVELLTTLQVALDEFNKDECDFKAYRKDIFEAHNIIDRL